MAQSYNLYQRGNPQPPWCSYCETEDHHERTCPKFCDKCNFLHGVAPFVCNKCTPDPVVNCRHCYDYHLLSSNCKTEGDEKEIFVFCQCPDCGHERKEDKSRTGDHYR